MVILVNPYMFKAQPPIIVPTEPPTQVGSTSATGSGWNFGTGVSIARPSSLLPEHVTILQILNYGSERDWSCSGFTLLGKASHPNRSDLFATVLVGTGHSASGVFAPTASNPTTFGDWTALTISSWANTTVAKVSIGTWVTFPSGVATITVPGIILPTIGRLLLVGGNGDGVPISSTAPAMTATWTHNDHIQYQRTASAGNTGDTVVTPSNTSGRWLLTHVGIRA